MQISLLCWAATLHSPSLLSLSFCHHLQYISWLGLDDVAHVLQKWVPLLLSEAQTALWVVACTKNFSEISLVGKTFSPPAALIPFTSKPSLQGEICREETAVAAADSNPAAYRGHLLRGRLLGQVFIMWKVCIRAVLQGGVVPVFTVLAAFNSNLFLMKPSWNVVPKPLI